MTNDWIDGNGAGKNTGDMRSQPTDAFGKVYFEAKQDVINFGMKVMAGYFDDQDYSRDNYFFSTNSNGNIITDSENRQGGGMDGDNSGSHHTFEPFGFDDDSDVVFSPAAPAEPVDVPPAPEPEREPENGFEEGDIPEGEEVFFGDPEDGFEVEDDENSFVFFGDELTVNDVDLSAFDEDGDEDVKVYHKGEYVEFDKAAKNPPMDNNEPYLKTPVDEKFDEEFFESVYTDRGRGFKTALIVITILVVIALSAFLFYRHFKSNALGEDTIYSGIRVNGYDLGGMTREEVLKYVRDTYVTPVQNTKIIVSIDNAFRKEYPITDFFSLPDADAIANEAYNYARVGDDADRLKLINALKSNPMDITVQYTYNAMGLQTVIANATTEGFASVIDPKVEYGEEGAVFTGGKHGARIDEKAFKEQLEWTMDSIQNQLKNIKTVETIPDKEIQVASVQSEFRKLDFSKVLADATVAPVDASIYRDGPTAKSPIKIVPDVPGRSLDEAKLTEVLSQINSGMELPQGSITLAYILIPANVTSESLGGSLYSTRLAEVTSKNTADPVSTDKSKGVDARSYNLKRAVHIFDTIYLLSGEEFRLLDLIGHTTTANDFTMAFENINDGGNLVSGGGISQFGTALFESVVRAGLEVTSVTHNKYFPNYGTTGFDAKISSDASNRCDLIFKNTLSGPVRISVKYENDVLSVAIDGPEQSGGAITPRYTLTSEKENEKEGGIEYTYRVYTVGKIEKSYGNVTYIKKDAGAAATTPSPTPEETPTPTPTAEETPTATPEDTPSPTHEDTPTPTPETPTPTPESETPTPTPVPDDTPSPTPPPEEGQN